MTKKEMISAIYSAEAMIAKYKETVEQLLKDPTQPISVYAAPAIQEVMNDLNNTIAEIRGNADSIYSQSTPKNVSNNDSRTFPYTAINMLNSQLRATIHLEPKECNILFCMQKALFNNYIVAPHKAIGKTTLIMETVNLYYETFKELFTTEQLNKVFYYIERLPFTKTGIHCYKSKDRIMIYWFDMSAADLASSS